MKIYRLMSQRIEKQLEQQGKQLDHQDATLTQQGKLLNGIAAGMGTVLEEQQAQRMDIRSLHTEVHASKEELKAEIKAARAEAKRDNADLKATVVKQLKNHEKRLTRLRMPQGFPTRTKTKASLSEQTIPAILLPPYMSITPSAGFGSFCRFDCQIGKNDVM